MQLLQRLVPRSRINLLPYRVLAPNAAGRDRTFRQWASALAPLDRGGATSVPPVAPAPRPGGPLEAGRVGPRPGFRGPRSRKYALKIRPNPNCKLLSPCLACGAQALKPGWTMNTICKPLALPRD